jgi:hypothetical protein
MRQIRRVTFALLSFIIAIAIALVTKNTWLNCVLSVVSCTLFCFHSTFCAVNAISPSAQVIAADTPAVLAQGGNGGLRNIGGIPVSGTPVPQLEVFDRANRRFHARSQHPSRNISSYEKRTLAASTWIGLFKPATKTNYSTSNFNADC